MKLGRACYYVWRRPNIILNGMFSALGNREQAYSCLFDQFNVFIYPNSTVIIHALVAFGFGFILIVFYSLKQKYLSAQNSLFEPSPEIRASCVLRLCAGRER